jgi:ribosomal protein S27AE
MKDINESILRKVQKLRIMIDRGTDAESKMAKNLFDKILERYEIDEEKIDERIWRRIKCSWEKRYIAIHIANSLEIEIRITGKWGDKYDVEVTEQEFVIFNAALLSVSRLYDSRKTLLMNQLQGYTKGFLDFTYSISKEDPKCPQCEHLMKVIKGKYTCANCGYIDEKHKVRSRRLNMEGYMEGAGDSGRLLEHRSKNN